MNGIFLLLHVFTAMLFLGPVTVAVSSFHNRAYAAKNGDQHAAGSAQTLHKITQTYGFLSLLVPGFGFLLMFTGDFWSNMSINVGMAMSIIAWAILIFMIIPRQKKMLGALGLLEPGEAVESDTVEDWDKAKKQLSMFGGIFCLLWVLTALAMLGQGVM